MDIQVSSNFERLLFESVDRDAGVVKSMMSGLKQSGRFSIPEKGLAAIRRQFVAGRTGEADTEATIKAVQAGSGYLLDPHSAVAVAVARTLVGGPAPVVTLSTAHPAKFPAAVKAAAGIEPALPAWLSDLYEREERYTVLDNDQAEVERFITARTRAGGA